jgi:hypothetical protein
MIATLERSSGMAARDGALARLRQHGPAVAAGAGAVGVIALGVWFYLSGDNSPPPRRVQEFTIVNVTPPPPPPPPPPEEKIPEEKMVDAPQMTDVKPEEKVETPKEAPPEPADEPPPGPLGLDEAAQGPGDSFNLAGTPGGRGLLGGGGGGSAWGYYESVVTREVEAALRSNPKTRTGVGQMQVRIWADQTGRVTRVQLSGTSGNPDIDAAIRGGALVGLALGSAPPSDMPMPIVTRITMRQPT